MNRQRPRRRRITGSHPLLCATPMQSTCCPEYPGIRQRPRRLHGRQGHVSLTLSTVQAGVSQCTKSNQQLDKFDLRLMYPECKPLLDRVKADSGPAEAGRHVSTENLSTMSQNYRCGFHVVDYTGKAFDSTQAITTSGGLGLPTKRPFPKEFLHGPPDAPRFSPLPTSTTMKPYSLDLRRRVLQAYLNEEGSQRQLADRFKVSPDFVYRLLKRYRETGSVAPAKVQRPKTAKVNAEGLQELKKLIKADPDATLQTLADRFEDAVGIDVSVATICRARQKLRSRHELNGHVATSNGAESRSHSENHNKDSHQHSIKR